MRTPLSCLLLCLFGALMFMAGCNPPSNPSCSPYIGQATINEMSKVQQNSDSANDFIEIRILSSSLSAATLNGWSILVCERGTTTCGGVALSSATVTGTGANRYYVLKSLANVGSYISFTNTSTTGTEVALADQNDYVVDYLTVGGNTAHQPTSCTFQYDIDAITSASTRRVQRIPDGTGVWDVVSSGNSSPPTEGASNDTVPPVTPAHFEVRNSGTGITCEPVPVTIRLHDASHNLITGYTGTVNISTSTNRGNWSLSSGSGTINNGVADDGAATYTFASTESSVTLLLSHVVTGTVNIGVTNGSVSETTGNYANHDDNINFQSAGLAILSRNPSTLTVASTVPTQISGKTSASGWNATDIILRAVQTNQTTYRCEAAVPAGSRNVTLSYQCITPATCASNDALTVAGNTIGDNPASGVTDTRTVSLAFDAQATATIPLIFNDAGAIRLNAATTITDSAGTTLSLSGSNTINVRPFGIRFENFTGNPGADETGTVATGKFVAAGSAFAMNLRAFAFGANEDMNSDGVPDSAANVSDNPVTANFTAPVALTVSAFTPGAGTKGTLGVTAPTFSAGTISIANQTYSEVGSAVVNAAVSSYLGLSTVDFAAALTKDSPKLGRFYPYDFYLSNVTMPAQSCSTFTYMSQPLPMSFSLVARNALGATTANYSAALNYANLASRVFAAESNDNGLTLGSRVSSPVGTWTAGAYQLNPVSPATYVGTISFNRSPTTRDGPYMAVQLGMTITDTDGAKLSTMDMLDTGSGTCTPTTCTAKSIGLPIQYRYGRLALRNTSGSDRARAIAIPALVEYFNGAEFVRNEADSCTLYGSSQINDVNYFNPAGSTVANSYSDFREPNSATFTAGRWWLPTTDQMVSSGQFRADPNGLRITPVPGVTGVLGVTLSSAAPGTIPAWLLFDWDGVSITPESGPSATVNLGSYRGHDRVILWRER